MPFKDKTGPQGQGPLTGRGFGRCIAPQSQEELNSYKERLKQELEQDKEALKKLEEKK